jgi:hypothetical protein
MTGSWSLLCNAPAIMLEQCISMVLSSRVRVAFLDRVELPREVGDLLHEELIHRSQSSPSLCESR